MNVGQMMTTNEVAAVMRVNAQTLRHMVAVGEFPAPFRRGRPWVWAPATVQSVLAGTWSPPPSSKLRAVS